jgi:hypothetical protein
MEDMMEEVMLELVVLVLNHVNQLSLVACQFVCTTWKWASPPPTLLEATKLKGYHSQQVAANSCLGVLQWVRANSCPWDKWMCAMVAAGGCLEVLQWAHTSSCPWTTTFNTIHGCLILYI